MKIRSAEFMIGAASPRQFPLPVLPEVAFVGKSNVGKSSLINCLLNRKHLVKTSSTPGRTREINFFLINGAFRFVDLPGYGFSRAAKPQREGWEALIRAYLLGREGMRGLVLILDARHAPGELDQAMVGWLAEHRLPFLAVANKIDKVKKAQVAHHLAALREGLTLAEPPLPCSAATLAGRDALWARLGAWLGAPPASAAVSG